MAKKLKPLLLWDFGSNWSGHSNNENSRGILNFKNQLLKFTKTDKGLKRTIIKKK